MAQAGFSSCNGCGRVFKDADEAEMIAMDDHDCEDTDVDVNDRIATARLFLADRPRLLGWED